MPAPAANIWPGPERLDGMLAHVFRGLKLGKVHLQPHAQSRGHVNGDDGRELHMAGHLVERCAGLGRMVAQTLLKPVEQRQRVWDAMHKIGHDPPSGWCEWFAG